VREQPIQTYHPSAKIRIIVRFDEFGASDTPKPPDRPPQLRTSGKAKKTSQDDKLEIVEQNGVLVLLGKGDQLSTPGGPQAQVKSSDNRTHAIELVPATMTIARNGIRTADTLEASFRFSDFPLDPRVLRSVAVEAFVGSFLEDELNSAPTDAPLVLADSFTDRQGNKRTNRRFSGWIDEFEADFGDIGQEPFITIRCTDNTRLLIEQEAPPKLAVDPEKPLDRAIAEYLANFPQFRGIGIEYRPAGTDVPLLKSALGKTAYKPKLGPAPSGGGGGSSKLSVWDYLTDITGTVGHVVRFEGENVVLQRARTLYGAKYGSRPDDPFTGRILPNGRVLDKRLFIHGANITGLRIRRQFARFAPNNIECRCYDPVQKKTLVARYPVTKEERQKRMLPGNGGSEQTWKVITVRGIRDEATLRSIAQGVYEAIGRNEIEAEFDTNNLASFGGDRYDPDVLDCLPGDAVDIEVARDVNGGTSVGTAEEALVARPASFLRALGFPEGFADAYAKAVANIGVSSSFRVKEITIDWSIDDGLSFAFRCVNFIEVRMDRELPVAEEPAASPADAQPVKVEVEPY